MIVLIATSLLVCSSHSLTLQEDRVGQSLNALMSRILDQMPECLVILMPESSTIQLPEHIHQMRASPNSNELAAFLTESYNMKCMGYLVDEENAHHFLTSLGVARRHSVGRGASRIVVLPNKAGNYSEILFRHNEAAKIPDMIAIQFDGAIIDGEEVKLAVITNNFQGNSNSRIGEVIGIWPTDTMIFFPDKVKDLRGKELIVSALHYPPFVLNQQEDGIEPRILHEFCRLYNCSVFFMFTDNLWGTIFDNGTGVGILGDVYMDRADIGSGAVYNWAREYLYVDYSYPFSKSYMTVLVPKPKQVEGWRTVFLPFSLTAWILLILSIVMAAIVMYYVNIAASKISYELMLGGEFATGVGLLFRAIGMSLLQPPPRLLPGSPLRRFLTIFEVLFVFFTSIYSGAISSALTVPKYYPAIDTPMQLNDAGISWVAHHEAYIYSIKDTKEPLFDALLKKFEVHDVEGLIDLIKKEECGICLEILEGGHVPQLDYISGETLLNYHLMKNELYSSYVVIALRKGSPYVEKMNKLIARCRAAGLTLLWETDVIFSYFDSRLQRALQISKGSIINVNDPIKLSILHIQGAFILLAIGLSFSCFICFLERIKLISDI